HTHTHTHTHKLVHSNCNSQVPTFSHKHTKDNMHTYACIDVSAQANFPLHMHTHTHCQELSPSKRPPTHPSMSTTEQPATKLESCVSRRPVSPAAAPMLK